MDTAALERLKYIDRIATGTYEGWNIIAQYTTDPKSIVIFYVCPIGEKANSVPKDKEPRLVDPEKVLDKVDASGPLRQRIVEQYRRIMLIQAPPLLRKYDRELRKE